MSTDLEDFEKKIQDVTKDVTHQKSNAASSSARGGMDENAKAGIHAGLEFVASIFLSAFMGYWLDQWLGTMPLFFLSFLFLGIGAGFYNVWRITENVGSSVGYSELHKKEKDAKTAPDLEESGKKLPTENE